MHELEELDEMETPDGRVRITWRCYCGSRGSGGTPHDALNGFKRHLSNRVRAGDY